MFFKCVHEWEKIAETTLPSGFEQMVGHVEGAQSARGINPYKKKYILVLACKKCGQLDKTIEES